MHYLFRRKPIVKMMWIFAVPLFLCPIATFGEDICKDSPYEVCPRTLSGGFKNLRSAQDVKDACPGFINYIACLGKYDETCGEASPRMVFPEEGEFESVQSMIADICDESSLLHEVLMENIQCFKDGMENDNNNTCYDAKTELAQIFSDTQPESSEYDEQQYTSVDTCFFHLYDLTCYLEYVVNKCGTMAKDAAIEVLQRSYFLHKYCQPESARDFLEVMDKLEISDSLKSILKELLYKILKKEP